MLLSYSYFSINYNSQILSCHLYITVFFYICSFYGLILKLPYFSSNFTSLEFFWLPVTIPSPPTWTQWLKQQLYSFA